MPLYEYECAQCGEIEEAIQKFSDAPLNTCRHCSGKLSKLISQSSFHLKGTGWYVTDYSQKSAAGSKRKKADVTTTGSDTGSSASAESKATKSDD